MTTTVFRKSSMNILCAFSLAFMLLFVAGANLANANPVSKAPDENGPIVIIHDDMDCVRFFSNPSTDGQINLCLVSQTNEAVILSIEILDSENAVVFEQNAINTACITLNLANLATGSYQIKVISSYCSATNGMSIVNE